MKAYKLRVLVIQEHVLSGGHGLMVQGYDPIIKALAKDIDVHLNHRYVSRTIIDKCFCLSWCGVGVL